MGKKLIIPNADFSANCIVIPLTIVVKAGGSVTIGEQTYTATTEDTSYEIDAIPAGFQLKNNDSVKYLRIGSAITLPNEGGGSFGSLREIEEIIFNADVITGGIANVLFANCHKLKRFDAKHLYFNAANASSLFYQCNKLEEVKNFIHFNPTNLYTFANCFSGCYELKTADLSGLETPNVTVMENMFINCSTLEIVKFGDGLSLASSPNVANMFTNCPLLRRIEAPSLVASDYNVSGTNTYKFIQGINETTGHVTINCGTGTLSWNGSVWTVS